MHALPGWGQRIPDPSASRMHLSGSMCFFHPARSPEASSGPGHLLGGPSDLWASSQHGDCEMPCGGCPWGCPAGRQCHAGSERGPQTPAVPPGLNSGCLCPPPPSSSFFPALFLGRSRPGNAEDSLPGGLCWSAAAPPCPVRFGGHEQSRATAHMP